MNSSRNKGASIRARLLAIAKKENVQLGHMLRQLHLDSFNPKMAISSHHLFPSLRRGFLFIGASCISVGRKGPFNKRRER